MLGFTYDDKRCLVWDTDCEILVEKWAKERALEDGVPEIQLEIKNELRKHTMEYIARRRGIKDPQVVITDFPVRQPAIASYHPFQKGCCVMDMSLLPTPPYKFMAV